jgi:hypothetical protein
MLYPSEFARTAMWLCAVVLIPAQLIVHSLSHWPSPAIALVNVVILLADIAGFLAFFSYRFSKRREQRALNSRALDVVGHKPFILYLRPFAASGHVPVRCLMGSIVDRWIMGRFWDLELGFALSCDPRWPLVAIGETPTSFGAAKVLCGLFSLK